MMNTDTRHFDGTLPFRVVPMRTESTPSATRLERAMRQGLTAVVDPDRPDFYSVEVDGVAYYFHVFEKNGTAYLVAENDHREDNESSVSVPERVVTH